MGRKQTEMADLLLGIDVGGTFTDFVALDSEDGIRVEKVRSSLAQPFECIAEGLERLGVKPPLVSEISYGTTIATNTVLERSGPQTGLLATHGFRDVLDMQRWHRQYLYDLHQRRPRLLVRRRDRLGIPERVAADGTVLEPVDEERILKAVEQLLQQGVTSLAVCFINAYANPVNERAVKRVCERHYPDLPVTVSTDVSPLIREYERTVAAVLNSYTRPAVEAHLEAVEGGLIALGFSGKLGIVQSNGGVISRRDAARNSLRTILSGPAGGVSGAAFVGRNAGIPNLITLDIGGTSCDVAVVRDGEPEVSKQEEIEWNLPVLLPMISVKTIGAGGGSIAWIDPGGILKVGPQSAGSDPGPVCYGRGGTNPTVTDAQLLLCRLDAAGLLGGRLPLAIDAAAEAIGELGVRLGLSAGETAAGVVRIANQRMIEATKLVTVDRGYDPRDFTLFAFGGAGPLHACEMAGELGIERVLVPPHPGVLSALGLAVADVKTSHVLSVNRSLAALTSENLGVELARLRSAAAELLGSHDVAASAQSFQFAADMRYENQSYEVRVPLVAPRVPSLEELARSFHGQHETLYHYAMTGEMPFVVNLEVIGIGQRTRRRLEIDGRTDLASAERRRAVYFFEPDRLEEARIIDRPTLRAGAELEGPAIIVQFDTTTVLPPGWTAVVDEAGNLLLTAGGQS